MKEPVDHILRPQLPWRLSDPGITECGYDSSKVRCLTRDEYLQRLKDMGQQRCAMVTCMTCSSTAGRWGTWEDDPRRALEREISWEGNRWEKRGYRLRDELVAIAVLVSAHTDEFHEAIRISAERRAWLEKKAAVAAKPKTLRSPGLL